MLSFNAAGLQIRPNKKMLSFNAAGFLDKPSVTLRVPSGKSARTNSNLPE